MLRIRNAILKRLARVDKLRHLVLDSLINFRSENAGNMTSMVGSIVEDNREQEKPIDREKVCIYITCEDTEVALVKFM